MPLALLLRQTFDVFNEGANKLDAWNRIVNLELLLLDRVRSAFLGHWFGPHVPLHGLNLRVALHNLDDLRKRYLETARSVVPSRDGLNLTEPLMGVAGHLAGALLSPSGVLALGLVALRRAHGWIHVLAVALITILAVAVVPPVGAAVGALLVPLGLVSALGAGLDSRGTVEQAYELLGSLADMIAALLRFLSQLVGPRDRVANPLIRGLLVIFDQLAALLSFVIAFLAIALARVTPLIRPLALQARLLAVLADSVVGTLAFVFEDWLRGLTALWADDLSPLNVLHLALTLMERLPQRVISGLLGVFDTLSTEFHRVTLALRDRLRGWLDNAAAALMQAMLRLPAVAALKGLAQDLPVVNAAFQRLAPAAPAPSSDDDDDPGIFSTLLRKVLPSPPPFPELLLPRLSRVSAAVGPRPATTLTIPPPVILPPTRQPQPRSVFTPLANQLPAFRAQEAPLRTALLTIVERVFPPAAAHYVPQLESLFRALETTIYQAPAPNTPAAELPVRELNENKRLQPVVHRLRVKAVGIERPAVNAWTDALRQALSSQPYVATGAT